jgi:hypothetical protein
MVLNKENKVIKEINTSKQDIEKLTEDLSNHERAQDIRHDNTSKETQRNMQHIVHWTYLVAYRMSQQTCVVTVVKN